MREKNIDQSPVACPQLVTWLANQVCALTEKGTTDLSVCGTMPNPLSHTSQGEAGRIFRCMLEKAEIAMNGVLKGNSGENSE